MKYRAWLSPTFDGLTIVCESQSESQNLNTWHRVARKLSADLSCPALAVMNHDDSVLVCALYDRGELVDQYDSSPDFSKPSHHSVFDGLRVLAAAIVWILTKPFPSFHPTDRQSRPSTQNRRSRDQRARRTEETRRRCAGCSECPAMYLRSNGYYDPSGIRPAMSSCSVRIGIALSSRRSGGRPRSVMTLTSTASSMPVLRISKVISAGTYRQVG